MSDKHKFAKHFEWMGIIDRRNFENALAENFLHEPELVSLYLELGKPSFNFGIFVLTTSGIINAVRKARKER